MRKIGVKVIDLIDIALVLLQSQCDRQALDFFLDLLPSDLSERDFNDYFINYKLVREEQRASMEDLAQQLKIIILKRQRGDIS